MARVIVYDGATNIGGSKIFLEEKGEGVFLDFGTNFARQGKFFQDYLKKARARTL